MLRANWLGPREAKDPARLLPPKRLVEKDTLSTECGYLNWPEDKRVKSMSDKLNR